MTSVTRRAFLRSAGALALLGLGGCRVGIASRDALTERAPPPSTVATSPVSSTTLATGTTSTTLAPGPTHLEVVAPPASIPNLDPIKWAESHIQRLYRPAIESLFTWQADGTARPLLAAGPWDRSRDGLVYTVQLRPDVAFHDGSRLDATSVVDSFQAVLDPANGSQWAPRFAGSLAGIEASGPSTIVFTLHRPFSPFETLLGLIPVVPSSEAYEPQLTFARSLAGTGPFAVTWDGGATLRYDRFDDYHGASGSIESFTLSFVEAVSAATRIEDGTADLAVAVGPDWTGPPARTAHGSTVRYRAVANLDPSRISSSLSFRHALWKRLDRRQVVEDVLGAQGAPSYSLISPSTQHASDQAVLRDLVPEPANLPPPGNEPLVVATVDDPTLRGVAAVVRAALAELGFESELSIVSAADVTDLLRLGEPDAFGPFDLFVTGGFTQPLSAFAPDYAYFDLRSGLVSNISKVSDPELDRLLDEAVAAAPEDRPARWADVQRYDVSTSLVEIPIAEGRYAEATTLAQYEPSPMGMLDDLARI